MRKLTYVDGIGTALASIASLVLWWFAISGGAILAMYRDLGGGHIGLITRIALHPASRFGIPLAIAIGIVLAYVRPVPRFTLLVIGVVAVVAAIATYAAAYAPLYELAGNIR